MPSKRLAPPCTVTCKVGEKMADICRYEGGISKVKIYDLRLWIKAL